MFKRIKVVTGSVFLLVMLGLLPISSGGELHAALVELNAELNDGKINDFFAQPTQGLQNNFEDAYSRFLTENIDLYQDAVDQNQPSYVQSMGVLGRAVIAVLVLSLLAWIGIRRILLQPLSGLIRFIHGISAGALAQVLDIRSRNGMGMLANNWKAF
jgi:nitrate/nitrite-specific signal transduction histidine kinase